MSLTKLVLCVPSSLGFLFLLCQSSVSVFPGGVTAAYLPHPNQYFDYALFNRYQHHIGISEGGLVGSSITISFSALQYKVIGVGTPSCLFYKK